MNDDVHAENMPDALVDDALVLKWAEVARMLLTDHAAAGRTTNYQKLYNDVSGYLRNDAKPNMMWRKWLGIVLGEVARLDLAHQSPLLGSLVLLQRSQRDEVSTGYPMAVRLRYGYTPELPQEHASVERRACFRFYRDEEQLSA